MQQAVVVVDDVDDPEVLIEDGRVLLHNKEDRILCVLIKSQLEAADHGVSVDVITPIKCFVKELFHLLWRRLGFRNDAINVVHDLVF